MDVIPKEILYKFNELLNVINEESDDLKMAAADASMEGDFLKTSKIGESYDSLQKLEENLKLAIREFESKKQSTKKPPINYKGSTNRTRKKGGHLRVNILGKSIEEPSIANTFIQALKIIGLERIEKLNKIVLSTPLLSKKPVSGTYPTQQKIENWYIVSHVNKQSTIRILNDICNELDISINIDTIDY